MSDKLKKALKYALSVLLAAALVYFAMRGVDWSSFADALLQTRWGFIALFAAASVLAIVFRALRWRDMLREIDPDAGLRHTCDALNIGNVVNVVLPGAGEFVRCGYVSNKNAKYDKVLGTIVMERAWDIVAIVLLLAAALVFSWRRFGGFIRDEVITPLSGRLEFSLPLLLSLLALTVLAVRLIRKYRHSNALCARICGFFAGIWKGFRDCAAMKHKLRFTVYTLLIWALYVLMDYFVLKAVPELSNLTMGDALFLSALGNVASVIPVPGGIGAYHYLLCLAFTSLYGVTGAIGLLFATLSHEIHAVIVLLLGLASYISLLLRGKTKK